MDKCTVVPMLACLYASVMDPLIHFVSAPTRARTLQSLMEPQWQNKVFWPAVAAISVVLVVRNLSRLGRLNWPPNIICLIIYLAFAGTSVLWAFSPELSFKRYVQQVMILTSIVLPAMLAPRTADMMRGLFLCFAFGSVLNVFFVLNNPVSIVKDLGGYPGYFEGKNYLGEFAALAFLLSLHEALYPGFRRIFGIIIVIIAAVLLFVANSKTALGLAFIIPCLAGLTLMTARSMRISPAILLLSIPVCYAVLSSVAGFNMNRLSYSIYGDSTFSGRAIIWDFANYEIARKPLLGWGYQSFWLVGPGAPSIVEAPGWVKVMPNAHNGYKDTMLEMGYVGLALLVNFIIATLHTLGRVAARAPARAWLLLSLALYIITYNFLESLWMRGAEFLWVVFVIVAAEAARYWHPSPSTRRRTDRGLQDRAAPAPHKAR
jgi:exopolysaccharide production protein ExoQ